MNKRGLSNVIAVILIILLSLAAIIIMWNITRAYLQKGAEKLEAQAALFQENMEISKAQFQAPGNIILEIIITKLGGKEFIVGEEVVQVNPEADVISVVDLSSSMQCSATGFFNCSENQNTCNICGGTWNPVTFSCSTSSQPCYIDQTVCTNGCAGVWNGSLNAEKDANHFLVDEILQETFDENRLGLTVYQSVYNASQSQPLTNNTNTQVLHDEIDSWTVGGGTCICCGINEASQQFTDDSFPEKDKALLVMSDGLASIECSQQNTGNAAQDAVNAACDAAALHNNLIIYSIGLGDNIDSTTLEAIAQCGNGQYYGADTSNIVDIYGQIAEEIVTQFENIQVSDLLLVVFYNDQSESLSVYVNPPENIYESEIYDIPIYCDMTVDPECDNQAYLNPNLEYIELYPVAVLENGEQIVGPLLDTFYGPF